MTMVFVVFVLSKLLFFLPKFLLNRIVSINTWESVLLPLNIAQNYTVRYTIMCRVQFGLCKTDIFLQSRNVLDFFS